MRKKNWGEKEESEVELRGRKEKWGEKGESIELEKEKIDTTEIELV